MTSPLFVSKSIAPLLDREHLRKSLPPDSVLPEEGADLVQLIRCIEGRFNGPGEDATEGASGTLGKLDLKHRHVVLLLVDGLGDSYLQRWGEGGFLLCHRIGGLTSVFPSTTASAITSVMTGLPPVQHGLLGWFVRDVRFGGIFAPLPLVLRGGGEVTGLLRMRRLFPYGTLFQRLACPSTVVAPVEILESPFNRRHSRGAQRVGYQRLAGLVAAIRQAIEAKGAQGGYVYAYYPRFDALSHAYGVGSSRVLDEFWKIDGAIQHLAEGLAGLGVDLLVTADHGFMDVAPDRTLEIDAWPEVAALLAAPLWGERRVAWCAARPGAEKEFEAAMRQRLGQAGVVLPTGELPSLGLFGRGRPHARLAERLGSHGIFMAPGWAIRDRVPGEVDHPMIGLHGGLSADEMRVPLIHVTCA